MEGSRPAMRGDATERILGALLGKGYTSVVARAMLSRTLDLVMRGRRPFVVAVHTVLFALAYVLAFGFRFEFDFGAPGAEWMLVTLPVILAARLLAFWVFHLFEGLWQYVGVRDILEMIKAVTLSSAVFALGVLVFAGHGFPRSILVLDWLLAMGLAGGVRMLARLLFEHSVSNGIEGGERPRVVIAGSGDLAEALLREIARGTLRYRVVGLVDDDPRKRGRRMHGVEVTGRLDDLPDVVARNDAQEVLLALAEQQDKRRVADLCRQAGVPVKAVPRLHDLLQGRAFIQQLRDVQTEDLLGRSTTDVDHQALEAELSGRRVLVTGAAGSIGSELARQVASYEPARLMLVDRSESGLYFMLAELRERYPGLFVEGRVGDICDEPFVRRVMEECSPHVVYHAAAYKHVPLMETQPLEAIRNNLFGTEVVAEASGRAGVEKFVLISTDKAVHPVSVMGTSKRAAECLLTTMPAYDTAYVAVRFGNVLGSDGSVVPLFQRQIASGSPITLTDPDATRYFMLISEAVELVLESGRIGRDGELYVLDMGEPIRIGDLANNLVRMAGLEPEIDVPVQVTGLRPGERLHEAIPIGDAEEVTRNGHEHILLVRSPRVDTDKFTRDMFELKRLVDIGDATAALSLLKMSIVALPSMDQKVEAS